MSSSSESQQTLAFFFAISLVIPNERSEEEFLMRLANGQRCWSSGAGINYSLLRNFSSALRASLEMTR
jgi:hypothetical protein